MEISKQTVVAFRLSKQAMEPLRSKRMATGYQYCAMLLLITMEISKQSVVGPSLSIMVYYCGRKSRRVWQAFNFALFCLIDGFSSTPNAQTYTNSSKGVTRGPNGTKGGAEAEVRSAMVGLVCVCCCGLSKLCAFGCLIGSSGKHRFKLPAHQLARQPVTTVRDWRCFLARGEDVIGVMKVVSVTRMIIWEG